MSSLGLDCQNQLWSIRDRRSHRLVGVVDAHENINQIIGSIPAGITKYKVISRN